MNQTSSKKDSGNDNSGYQKDSLSLAGAVSLGTGVMIGAGIFALTGQVAELAREWFPFAFVVAAVVGIALIFAGERWFLRGHH